ncbi:MAG: hypothetical protein JST54_21905 [Deltaproteobacteria bacterium]|nr:hypothetical protein [Deltaproteobacteria bacterium]
MRACLLVLTLAAVPGCRQWTAPDAPHAPGSSCSVDTDCGASAVCNQGQCDTTHCRLDAQCSSQICIGANDAGALGSCGSRTCYTNADCGTNYICTRVGTAITCEPGCDTDADCPMPEVCNHHFSSSGSCMGSCRTDADCGATGHCYLSQDGETSCTATQITNCHSDADCPACELCTGQNGAPGVCYSLNQGFDGGGPPVLGSPAALAMTDNLSSTVSFIEGAFPGAQLVRIGGFNMQADGTVNVSNATDYESQWQYEFVLPDGGGAEVFFNSRAHRCGEISVGEPNDTTPILDAVIPELITPAALIAQFTAQPNCQGWAGTTSDFFSVLGSGDGGGEVLLDNRAGDDFLGDAVTGQGTSNCP